MVFDVVVEILTDVYYVDLIASMMPLLLIGPLLQAASTTNPIIFSSTLYMQCYTTSFNYLHMKTSCVCVCIDSLPRQLELHKQLFMASEIMNIEEGG